MNVSVYLSKQSPSKTKFDHEPEDHTCKQGLSHGENITNSYICHVLDLSTTP